jgi:hypothetical protein
MEKFWRVATLLVVSSFLLLLAGNIVRSAMRPDISSDVKTYLKDRPREAHTTENFMVWAIQTKRLK